jgi:hypothetical protein
MRSNRHGYAMAVKEHLHSGKPITRLEAMILFGVADLTKIISDLRKEGWTVHSKRLAYVAAVKRVNEHAVLEPPANLPVREIQLTEYWMGK